MKTHALIAAVLALGLSGCASNETPQTLGDEIRSSGFGNLAGDWDKSNRAVSKAEDALAEANKRVSRGERTVKEARRDLERGEENIARGKRERREAERRLSDARAERDRVEARFRKAENAGTNE